MRPRGQLRGMPKRTVFCCPGCGDRKTPRPVPAYMARTPVCRKCRVEMVPVGTKMLREAR